MAPACSGALCACALSPNFLQQRLNTITTWFVLSLLLPQAYALEAGQDFLDEIGQLVIVGDEAEAEPVEAGISELLELASDSIGITYRQQPAIARAIARTQLFRLLARHRPLIGGTEIQVEHGVDGAVVAVLDRKIVEVLVGPLLASAGTPPRPR